MRKRFVLLGIFNVSYTAAFIGMYFAAMFWTAAPKAAEALSIFDQPTASLQDSLKDVGGYTNSPSDSYTPLIEYTHEDVPGYVDSYGPTYESGTDFGIPCSVGRSALKKLGKRSWEVVSLTPTSSSKVRVELYRETQHKTAQASSISIETACVILPAEFWKSKKVRVRHGELVAAR